jgi:hypothetical protein
MMFCTDVEVSAVEERDRRVPMRVMLPMTMTELQIQNTHYRIVPFIIILQAARIIIQATSGTEKW